MGDKTAGEHIANGHGRDHFSDFPDVDSLEDLEGLVDGVVMNPDAHNPLKDERDAYWIDEGNLVIADPSRPHGGSVYRPSRGREYFDGPR